jgi:hypothetical protein
MRLNEIVTKVRVFDGEKRPIYLIDLVDPEAAKQRAMAKHRARYGYGSRSGSRDIPDRELRAEIIPNTGPLKM